MPQCLLNVFPTVFMFLGCTNYIYVKQKHSCWRLLFAGTWSVCLHLIVLIVNSFLLAAIFGSTFLHVELGICSDLVIRFHIM